MDKKTFMRELSQALSVLQEEELNDIINEYEQHIDMKMKNGLTEDEAIADFGSLPELTADILEAYHVRADYASGQGKEKKALFGNEGRAAGKEIIQQTKKGCRAALTKPFITLKEIWKNRQDDRAVGDVRDFEDMEELEYIEEMEDEGGSRRAGGIKTAKEIEAAKEIETVGESKKTTEFEDAAATGTAGAAAGSRNADGINVSRRKKSILRRRSRKGVILGAGNFIVDVIHRAFCFASGCVHLGWKLALWATRAAWNICCVVLSLLCGGFGLFCLYILGLLVVLWMQHYPLAGVTIGCLGLVLCAFSAAGLCLTLLWRKKHKKAVGTDDPTGQNRKQDVVREEALMEKEESAVWYQEMEGGHHA